MKNIRAASARCRLEPQGAPLPRHRESKQLSSDGNQPWREPSLSLRWCEIGCAQLALGIEHLRGVRRARVALSLTAVRVFFDSGNLQKKNS